MRLGGGHGDLSAVMVECDCSSLVLLSCDCPSRGGGLNSLLLCGMLFETSSSGIPCLAKIDFMCVTIVPAVLSRIS